MRNIRDDMVHWIMDYFKRCYCMIFVFMIIHSMTSHLIAIDEENRLLLRRIVVFAESEDDTAQTGDVSIKETSAFLSVIDRESFEGKMADISEIVEKEAALKVRQSGGLGSFSTASLRGSSSDQVLVYMDGILLNESSGGGVDLSRISLSDVESIEIYRGLTPINFGRASIGGVINIKTKRSSKGLKGSASAGYGSFNTLKFVTVINHKPGNFDYLICGDYISSDNDFKILNDNGTQYNKTDDRWETRRNNQFDQQNLLVKLGYDFTSNIRIDLANQYFTKDQNLPCWNNLDIFDTSLLTDRIISTLKMTVDELTEYHFNTYLQLNYSYKEEEYDDRYGAVGLGRQHSLYMTTAYGSSFFFEWPTKYIITTFVFNANREEYKTDNYYNIHNYIFNPSSRDTISAGIENSLFLFERSLIIRPAIRWHYIRDKLESGTDFSGKPEPGRRETNYYFSPQIGCKYLLYTWLCFKSNFAKYVREPSFLELFGDRGFFEGNHKLEAEKGVNFDVGFEINSSIDNSLLSRISFSAAYFRSDVEDIIAHAFSARGTGKAENISEAEINGIECGFAIDIMKYLGLSGSYTWQDTVNKGEIEASDGMRLPGRFEESLFGKIEIKCGWIKLYCEYMYDADMFYDSANLLPAKDREEYNAGVSIMRWSFILNLEAKNLGDNHYEDFHGYPLPGISYYANLKYTF
ncbi:MAG: TonB-dependent receptor plug domain-containing protein [Spirochaetota bacterium]|nr:TonB-dependent receptor plug domain-containing protein [Spirochaetota bacterium]